MTDTNYEYRVVCKGCEKSLKADDHNQIEAHFENESSGLSHMHWKDINPNPVNLVRQKRSVGAWEDVDE